MVGSDFRIVCLLCAALCISPQIVVGQAIPPMGDKPAEKAADGASGGAASSKFEAAIKGAKKVEGLWTVYFKEQQVLVDLKSSKLGEEYLMLTSIAKGVSQGPVLGGMTWGDDVVWSFRKVGERVHVLRKNVRFKAKQNSPEANAVKLAYSDSVLYALPIVTDTPGGHLVDMTRIFMSDDEQIGRAIGAPLFANDRSTVAKVQAYRRNVEIQINAVYSSMSANNNSDTVPDSRGTQVAVHYSISELPKSGYRPRKADDRVGYFLTAAKDFSDTSDDQHFVRYITRWDLQKAAPEARLSPPKQPITFYLEKTLPVNLRPTVRSGIEEWNKSFEKLGFANAIEVRQQTDDDTWDPEDVNFNTFRWITAEAGFAMGPSRVNPYTGQILDADIIFDASFLRYWKNSYETFKPVALDGDADGLNPFAAALPGRVRNRSSCEMSVGMQHQMGFAAAAMATMGQLQKPGELPEEYIHQALKEVVMHEVGHTLGLRHNFKASAWKSLAEISDPAKKDEPTAASVMDYLPVNINPTGPQSAYYTTTIGPYDYWAIEYGYKVINGDENAELAKIASRSGEPGLDYGTDEDTRGTIDPDPLSNRFDLGKDPVEYAARQMKLAQELMPKVVERTVKDGEGYQRARQAFGLLLREFSRTANFVARLPGGVEVRRDHKGDANGRSPFQAIPAGQQRAGVKLLTEVAFASPKIDTKVINSLSSTRWYHWGIELETRNDYPIFETLNSLQTQLLSQLLGSTTLRRLQDSELKTPADQDCYTMSEHLKQVFESVFSEILTPGTGQFTSRSQYLSTFRRSLQRSTLRTFSGLVTMSGYPDDARLLARTHLQTLEAKLAEVLAKNDLQLDDYSRAHVADLQVRVKQVLNAELVIPSAN